MGYIAKGKVLHNGKYFNSGDEVPGLKKDEAERLIELGAVEEEKKATKGEQAQG